MKGASPESRISWRGAVAIDAQVDTAPGERIVEQLDGGADRLVQLDLLKRLMLNEVESALGADDVDDVVDVIFDVLDGLAHPPIPAGEVFGECEDVTASLGGPGGRSAGRSSCRPDGRAGRRRGRTCGG